jgi:hypothetical protein
MMLLIERQIDEKLEYFTVKERLIGTSLSLTTALREISSKHQIQI